MSRRRLISLLLGCLLAATLIALSAARLLLQRPSQNPDRPNRSSFHAGPEGSQAFYQWLGESGYRAQRWRDSYQVLEEEMGPALLIVVGLSPSSEVPLRQEEVRSLHNWLRRGGHLLLLSEHPAIPFDGVPIEVVLPEPPAGPEGPQVAPSQPTHLTRGIRQLIISPDATRLILSRPRLQTSPRSKPFPAKKRGERGFKEAAVIPFLEAPVIHVEDDAGALLADFQAGKGRVILLTDSSLFSNQGLPKGDHLRLAQHLIAELTRVAEGSASKQPLPVLFDEYHHGYRSERNNLLAYFQGTPTIWILLQGLLLGAALSVVAGKRFARPLPRRSPARHSPLEFLSSIARLRQAAEARDLAIESIYPRFRQLLCRRLSCSVQTPNEELISRLAAEHVPIPPQILQLLMLEAELVLHGQPIDDRRLLRLVQQLRITARAFAPLRSSRSRSQAPSPFPHGKEKKRTN
ncbi:MAG: DUF4350 domain-containing protein [Blastocatellia bacterium]